MSTQFINIEQVKKALDETTIQKQCVGCGRTYVAFRELADETQYCSDTCREAHSIFNVNFE